jgi:hypothetical protein
VCGRNREQQRCGGEGATRAVVRRSHGNAL